MRLHDSRINFIDTLLECSEQEEKLKQVLEWAIQMARIQTVLLEVITAPNFARKISEN